MTSNDGRKSRARKVKGEPPQAARGTGTTVAPQKPFAFSAQDRAEIARFAARPVPATPPAIKISGGVKAPLMSMKLSASHPGSMEAALVDTARVANAFAGANRPMVDALMLQLTNCIPVQNDQVDENAVNRSLAMVTGLAPRDEHEAMLTVQMVATHNAIMLAHRRLSGSTSIAQQDSNGRLLNQLQRTYAAQLEALARYRNRGKQEVRVVHQHVNVSANQAAVAINPSPRGEGVSEQASGQPDGRSQGALDFIPGETLSGALETHAAPVPECTG